LVENGKKKKKREREREREREKERKKEEEKAASKAPDVLRRLVMKTEQKTKIRRTGEL
jgi:hypothetical protein